MLYDRLVRDLVTAEQATRAGQFAVTTSELVHAQAIVLELRTSLDLDVWDGAAGLAALYTYLLRRARRRQRQEGRGQDRGLPTARRAAARRLARGRPAEPPAVGVTPDWSTWLDQLEASITAQRAALADGRHDDVVAGQPPVDLGPLPADLAARASRLLQLNTALTEELAASCAAHGRQLQLVSAMHRRETSASSYLDTRT